MSENTSTRTVTLEFPDRVLSVLKLSPEEIIRVLRLSAAVQWFERGVLDQEKAVQIAGVTRDEFLSALKEKHV